MPLPNNPGLPNQRPKQPGQGLPRPNPQRDQQNNARPNPNGRPNPNQAPGQRQQNQGQQRPNPNPNAPQPQQRRPNPNPLASPPVTGQQNPMIEEERNEKALQARNSEEYNFDAGQAQLRARLQQTARNNNSTESFQNEFDNDADETFEPLSIDEQLKYEDQEEEEQKRRDIKRRAAERRAQQKAEEIKSERRRALESEMNDQADVEDDIFFDEESNPESTTNFSSDLDDENVDESKKSSKKNKNDKKDMFEDNVKDEHGQDVFVDEKNGKLLPFGSKNGKKEKTKEHEYDDRKNMRTQAVIVQFVLIAGLLVLMGLGVKNTFFPEPAMSEEDITGIISETVDLTNFPLERGGGFATDFAQAYLSTDQEGKTANAEVLSYFYSGTMSEESSGESSSTRVVASGYTQNILYGPTIYESVALTDYSARYTVGAVVEPKPPTVESEDPAAEEETSTVPQWIFLNINVYYDAKTDMFTITPDSPSVLPGNPVGTEADLPAQQILGEEVADPEIADKVQPVIYGFLNGYRESTTDNHSTLDQYVISNPPASLTQGLGGNYTFSGETVENAVTYTIFSNEDEPGVMKVLANVTWLNGATEDTSMQLSSTYVITLEEQENGMYLVSKFQPLYFVQDEEAVLAQEEADAEEAAKADTEE